jgi:hypothetical protein
MEQLDLNHLNSFYKVSWVFDNIFGFSNLALLDSSNDALGSLSVYDSSPRH